MTLAPLFDKLLAVIRRDLLQSIRYRRGFWIQLAVVIAELVGFYYLAYAVGPSYRPEGMDYYAFLLAGTSLYGFLIAGASTFVSTIHDAQVTGTMEVMMTTSTRPAELVLLSAVSAFAGRVLFLVVYIAFGLILFRVGVRPNWGASALVLLLSLVLALSLGMLAAALQVTIQKGETVIWLFSSVLWVLTGTMFPISALPQPLQKLSALLPVSYSINGFRMAFLNGASWHALARPMLLLGGSSAILMPLSLLLFSRAVRSARQAGTLSFY